MTKAGNRELGTGSRETGTGNREPVDLDQAYNTCIRLAREHYENFPVASRLLPRALRRHVAAIYAFARMADDFADEPGREAAERLALLDDWGARLRRCREPGNGPPPPGPPSHPGLRRGLAQAALGAAEAESRESGTGSREPGTGSPHVPGASPAVGAVFRAVGDTIQRFDLPVSLLEDLLSAFRQDVTTTRYASWDAVLDYCRRSANPVGRLVLRLSGYRDETLDRASDAVCTALQLTNFWQDLVIDWRRGRLYVPEEAWRARGAEPGDLDGSRITPAWQAALQDCANRTRALFDQGRPVADLVRGRLRWELRATWLGGMRILDRLERRQFDVFSSRPVLAPRDAVVIGCRTLFWRRSI